MGIRSTTIASSDFPSGYTFASSLSMLLLDSIVWGFTTWYLNRLLAGDYGVGLPWYFPFTRQYWCPKKSIASDTASAIGDVPAPAEEMSKATKKQRLVHIHSLRKSFGNKTAVDGLNLSMYSGQITSLLGHNGAGAIEYPLYLQCIVLILAKVHLHSCQAKRRQ